MRNRITIVDIATRKFKALSYKQYDVNNLLQMIIVDNGKIIDISSYTSIIYFKMPSGKIYREFGDIKNNTIDIILPSDVLYESGKVTLEAELRETDKVVTTFSIYLNVEKSIDSEDITNIDGTTLEDIRHFHYNKDVLDTITQEMIDKWNSSDSGKNNLSDFINDVGFVNEQYVIDKIVEAQLGGGDIELTDYVKKTQMNEEIEKLKLDDKNILTQSKDYTDSVSLFKTDMNTVSSLGGIPAGTNLNDLTIQEVLTKLLFPYIAPSVSASLTYSPNASIYEYGRIVSVTNINARVTKKSESIQNIKFYKNNNLINTISTNCSNGGTFSYTLETSVSITSNTSNSYFKVIVYDGTTNVTANTNSFTFVYPYYYGVINNDAEINETLIKNLTKQVVAKGNKTYSYSPNFQKMVIAYPKSYGVLKSILDPNGFEQMASFTLTKLNIVGLDGTPQPYYVYSNGASTNTNFNMTFKY